MLIVGILVLSFAGCSFRGYDFVDTNYHFDMAQIEMPDGTIVEGEVSKWADSEDGEQITVTFKDGNRYLVHSENIVMWENR